MVDGVAFFFFFIGTYICGLYYIMYTVRDVLDYFLRCSCTSYWGSLRIVSFLWLYS